ncbi:unnamed protein product [Didymodactylos carnosus]|uniref:Uncharacterized protein n=1 Tax=Didymodactylos carnosus TaxID=1234261 RepID=A0A815KAE3_9BILA|nr:unnamed protein product [Didymodactylos carnosus]CAF1393075.1 unnamed protein product [Didymodactylos carnosus]CAF3882110.1 unnamed protein product [Didymodactylos carnosus]CAF4287320.1 unnamed protein product [Didymodactylos carnosus]
MAPASRTLESLYRILQTSQRPHSLPSSPHLSKISHLHIQENINPSITNITRYESLSNENLQQEQRSLTNDDNDPIELDRMDSPSSTNQQQSSATKSPLQKSTSITSVPVLTNILSPVHVPFSIFDPMSSINSATTTTLAYTSSISHFHEVHPQRLMSNKDIPLTNRRCPCSYCNTLSYSIDHQFIDTGCSKWINQQSPQSYSNQHSNFFQQDSKNLHQQYPQLIRYSQTATTSIVQSLAPQQYLIQPLSTYYQQQIPQTTYYITAIIIFHRQQQFLS